MPDRNEQEKLLELHNGVSFFECLERCLHSEMLQEWERLEGKKLLASNPLERMIDRATGYDQEAMKLFSKFVYEHIWVYFKKG